MVTNRRGSGRRAVAGALAIIVAAAVLAGCGGGSDEPAASSSAAGQRKPRRPGERSCSTSRSCTVLDQPIAYPKKTPAQVSSAIVQLEPGQETGWHKHKVPMYAYVLEGTISVEYDAGVTKEYAAGTALMEAQNVWHNGTNKGDAPVRILTVYMGAKGAKNTVERAP